MSFEKERYEKVSKILSEKAGGYGFYFGVPLEMFSKEELLKIVVETNEYWQDSLDLLKEHSNTSANIKDIEFGEHSNF